MNEAELLERISRVLARQGIAKGNGIVTGIGDDCAVFRSRTGEDLLFTADQMHEDRHFTARTKAAEVGYLALARSLSDIAAMGGQPLFAMVSIAAPETGWIDGFYEGFLPLAARHGVVLAGGDLSRTEKPCCDVMVCGQVARGRALLRSAGRAGDTIYVSGALGGAARALAGGAGFRPKPRLALGATLYAQGVRCAMDLSDGLSMDLQRICVASGVTAMLERVPVARGATLGQALHGGEDYELLFTAKGPVKGGRAIGRMVAGSGEIYYQGERLLGLGWDHFSGGQSE